MGRSLGGNARRDSLRRRSQTRFHLNSCGEPMAQPITVLISCRNRPLYLWASLDSLYRCTRYPHRFVFLDMASDDPLVGAVTAGFARRGMFAEVIRSPRNDPRELWKTIWSLVESSGPFFGYVEGDVIVAGSDPCWLGTFVGLMDRNQKLAMIGPAIDKEDFIPWERARIAEPGLDDERLAALIKLHSPERGQNLDYTGPSGLAYPHNPPGRMVLMRCAALTRVGAGTDGTLDRKFRDAGYDTGIAPTVRHRHLSLLNLFDYPDYDTASRDAFMRAAAAG